MKGVKSIDRTSINSWEDQDFVDAVKATGRKKLIIKLMTGKMVAPALVEDALILSPFILQIVLVGSEEKYLTAFLVPTRKQSKNLRTSKASAM